MLSRIIAPLSENTLPVPDCLPVASMRYFIACSPTQDRRNDVLAVDTRRAAVIARTLDKMPRKAQDEALRYLRTHAVVVALPDTVDASAICSGHVGRRAAIARNVFRCANGHGDRLRAGEGNGCCDTLSASIHVSDLISKYGY